MIPTSTNVSVDLSKRVPAEAEAVVVFLPKGSKPGAGEVPPLLSEAEQAAVQTLLEAGAARGNANEVAVQLVSGQGRSRKPRRVMVVGLGPADKLSAQAIREAAATGAKAAKRQKLTAVALIAPTTQALPDALPGLPGAAPAGRGAELAVQAMAEGFLLGSFLYDEHKGTASKSKQNQESPEDNGGGDEKPRQVRLTLVAADGNPGLLRNALERGRITADAQNYARTIASRPGNQINPPSLAQVAQDLARQVNGLKVRVLDERQLKRLGMGGILAVGAGSSATPPRLIVLEYMPRTIAGKRGKRNSSLIPEPQTLNPHSRTLNPLLIVGKAITFDTGGISIKPAEKMGRMIFDKSGGVAVLGLMYAVAKLNLPVPVVGILSSAENHISERAYRPGDVLRMYNGVTVEVTNTDAEGRLVLGDALAWGIDTYKPSAVVDLATLTGGVIVALGRSTAGVMCNNDELFAALQGAAEAAGEKLWRLPLWEEHRDLLKSTPADIVNSGGRDGHPLQGGAFLSHFVPQTLPWAHLDIAGVADTEKDLPLYGKGATGWGIRTLVQWISARPSAAASGDRISAKGPQPASTR